MNDQTAQIIASTVLEHPTSSEDWVNRIEAEVRAQHPEFSNEAVVRTVNQATAILRDQRNIDLPKQTLHALPCPVPPLRGETYAQGARHCIAMRKALDKKLQDYGRRIPQCALPDLIIASAALRGGLWRLEGLLALAKRLETRDLVISQASLFPGLVSIELTLKIDRSVQSHTNCEPGAELLRWFPDVVTLALLSRWQHAGPLPYRAPRTTPALYKELLHTLEESLLSGQLSAGQFPSVASATLEAVSEVALPSAIEAVASGQLPAVCLPHEEWRAFCMRGPSPKTTTPPMLKGMNKRSKNTTLKPSQAAAPACHTKNFAKALKDILQPYRNTSSVRGRRNLSEQLFQLQQDCQDACPALHALISWFRALLANGNKPRTICDYDAAIGTHVRSVFGRSSPWDLDTVELRALFERVLSQARYSDPSYPLGRLAHFAWHAHNVVGWPDADLADLTGTKPAASVSFVRAAVLPMSLYPQAFEDIRNTDRLPPDMAECYAMAFAMLAYGGLRIDEAKGRVVADIAPDLTIYVHATEKHGLKSEAARRLVPMALFADQNVARQCKAFVAKRRNVLDPGKERLLDLGTLFPEYSFNDTVFRRLLAETIGARLQLNVRPHDFRHTLVSAVHLLFQLGSEGADTIEAATGWSPSQQTKIRKSLLGAAPNPGLAARQISAFPGHRELQPVSLSSYCHLSDLAMGHLISQAKERLPSETAARLLALNTRSIAAKADKRGSVRLEDLRLAVVRRLKVQDLPVQETPETPGSKAPPTSKALSPTRTHALLKLARQGHDPLTIADSLNLDVSVVRRAISIAKQLMETRTQKSGCRLATAEGKPALLPVARFAGRDAGFLRLLLSAAENTPADNLRAWSETLIARSNARQSYLAFKDAKTAASWLSAFPAALPMGSIEITILCPKGLDPAAAIHAWQREVQEEIKISCRASRRASCRSPTPPGQIAFTSSNKQTGVRLSFSTLLLAAFCIAVSARVQG